jgi:P-type conjugative transfer protein TrbG
MRHLIFILLLSLSKLSFADEDSNYAEELKAITKVAELQAVNEGDTDSDLKPKFSEAQAIDSLLDEVERIKTREVVSKRNILNTENPRKAKALGSSTIYPYIEGKLFEVHTGIDKVTDIRLQSGEELTSTPVSGDTVRWKIAVLKSEEVQTHLIVKPLEDNLETNLIVPTNKRVYHLKLMSGAWYMPQVFWNYPEDERQEIEKQIATKKKEEEIGVSPDKLSFAYDIEGKDYDWKPLQVFDDGNKTFIRMPDKIKASEAPALFVLDEDDTPMLINYRVKEAYYIVDRIFQRAELKVGEKASVTIYSEKYDRSFF